MYRFIKIIYKDLLYLCDVCHNNRKHIPGDLPSFMCSNPNYSKKYLIALFIFK